MYVLLCKGAVFFRDLVYVHFGDLVIPRPLDLLIFLMYNYYESLRLGFYRASLKLGLDKAVLQSSGSASSGSGVSGVL